LPFDRRSDYAVELLEGRTLLSVPHFDHVVVVMEENESYGAIIGNPAAPYMNSLARQGASLTNLKAVARPSQPNYVALFSGSTQGVTSDAGPLNFGNTPNLGSQLFAAGKTFVGYAEDLPAVGSTVLTSGKYDRKHNPWVNFSNVPASSNRPFSNFPTDFSTLPTVSMVVPNEDHNSHDGPVADADAWLQAKLGGYAAWAKTHSSLLIVTWDEGTLSDETNHIPTIFYGAGVTTGQYGNAGNLYNVLRTIEDSEGLPALGNAAGAATMDYVFGAPTTTLAAPTNLVATSVSATQINLTWSDNATNETGYRIERSTDGVNFAALAGGGSNIHAYNNTGLTAGHKYYYRVYAVNGTIASGYSNVASAVAGQSGGTATAPAAPSSLFASAANSSAINLSWADNSTNETGFSVERSTDGVNFSAVGGVGANVRSWASTGLAASTKYYYRVRALGSAGNSGYSNVGSATTQGVSQAGAPAAPTNLTLAKSTSVANAINLSWIDNASNETGYKIERSTDGVHFAALAGGGSNLTFYRNTGLTPGHRYYYRVYAVNAAGNSLYSNVASLLL